MSTTIPHWPGLFSTEIQRAEFSVPGREVIVNRVEVGPEARPIRHKHPGEEIVYVLDGAFEYMIDGQEPIIVQAGEGLTVPAETVHATSAGTGTDHAVVVATHIVEKDKPFLVLADE
jgi:quercetin dioxygenase-like cupin family protein